MFLDRAVKWLLPREEHFFDLLERGAACAKKSSELLVACCSADTEAERAEIVDRATDEEHVADRVIHEVYEALNKTFVTPLDRSDIYALATDLENITDAVTATMMQLKVHAMELVPKGSVELAELIAKACDEIAAAVKLLRRMRELDEVRAHCRKITLLEHDGDQVFRQRIGEMFKIEKDAVLLLKNKEFLEGLERTLDACDDVANSLETLVIKHA